MLAKLSRWEKPPSLSEVTTWFTMLPTSAAVGGLAMEVAYDVQRLGDERLLSRRLLEVDECLAGFGVTNAFTAWPPFLRRSTASSDS